MKQERRRKLDELFEAFSMIAYDSYVFLCDMKEDFSRWSQEAVNFFNLPDIYMKNAGDIWEKHIHPDDRAEYHKSIENIFAGIEGAHDMQYRARSKDGTYTVCTCRGVIIRDVHGNPEYFGGAIKNHGVMSYVDAVTGLRSLYGFFDDLQDIFTKREEYSVLLTGISNFSNINDIYGYTFGNSVIQKLGIMLKEKYLNKGAVYRMDGTKFAIISRELSPDQLSAVYKELKSEVAHDFYVNEEHISISVNAGIVRIDNFDISKETVYSCMKYAYYESKSRRLGDAVIFADELSDDNRILIEKLNVIRNSVSENCKGFYLCYQPIMDAGTEQLKGMEALIRWKNDIYGTIPPIQFIPVLEQDPLFPELGRWILQQAMEDGKKMLKKYPDFIMNVNLSYAQLEQNDFVDMVLELLDQTGYPPRNLCLEITERCRLLDMTLLKKMFSVFREKGIRVALDDFGTGFSSLGILRELPVDTVKIDREYVKNVEKSASDQNTVKFISNLADAFSAEVCVEGVESAQMRDFLKNYGVNSLQGYFYSKPIPFEEFVEKYVRETFAAEEAMSSS